MKKGRVTGPEYFAITSGKDVELYGIETKDKYNENLEAFKKTMPYRSSLNLPLKRLKKFSQLKPKIYNRQLLLFDKELTDYENQKVTFSKYCEYLIDLAQKQGLDIAKYENMKYFGIVAKLEGAIDFEKVDQERNDLIEGMRPKLSSIIYSELLVKTTHYKQGKLTALANIMSILLN